jgi:hypothetical protein
MNCPLCGKILLEISADEESYGDDIDYICSHRIVAGTIDNIPYTLSHFEWRAEDEHYLVQVPPYNLRVYNKFTNVYKMGFSTFADDNFIIRLESITKDSLSTFGKNYEQLSKRIKGLILFS